jgi:DNA-directed RNA polymerase subunit RPC12/RpoP
MTIKCQDCGGEVVRKKYSNNTKRCAKCAAKARNEARRLNLPMCECQQGRKTHRLYGCAKCNAAFEAAHHREHRAIKEENFFTESWYRFKTEWLAQERRRQGALRRGFMSTHGEVLAQMKAA